MNTRMHPFLVRLLAVCGVAGLSGCGSGARSAGDFELHGQRIIACCCHTPCPCRMNYKPTHCHGCDYSTAVRIDRGHIDGVSMDGLAWVVTGRTFSETPTENWTYIYISDRANAEQMAALQRFFEAGGRELGAKGKHLVGDLVGMRKAPLTWEQSADGRDWSARIPGVLAVRTRSIVLPGRSRPVTSSGIFDDFGDTFIHADCLEHSYSDAQIGRQWKLAGRQSNQAQFSLTSARASSGGIGWGCWSAHAELGDRDHSEYQEKITGHD
jgi:hypothetical protein